MPNDPGSSQRLDGGIFIGESPNVGTPGFGVQTAFGRTVGGFFLFHKPILTGLKET